jgi:hypothetical protein
MSATVTNSEAAILSRLIIPARGDLSADAARSILNLQFDEQDRERMHELARMRQEGALSEDDEAELDRYRHIGHFLEMIQSKARLSLAALSAPPDAST